VSLLELHDVRAGYGDSVVLDGISLELPEEGSLAVLGRNGVGKSTLLLTIMGFTRMRRGRIVLGGVEISRLPAHRRAQLGIGWVAQEREIPRSASRRTSRGGARGPVESEKIHDHSWLAERRANLGNQSGRAVMLAIARADDQPGAVLRRVARGLGVIVEEPPRRWKTCTVSRPSGRAARRGGARPHAGGGRDRARPHRNRAEFAARRRDPERYHALVAAPSLVQDAGESPVAQDDVGRPPPKLGERSAIPASRAAPRRLVARCELADEELPSPSPLRGQLSGTSSSPWTEKPHNEGWRRKSDSICAGNGVIKIPKISRWNGSVGYLPRPAVCRYSSRAKRATTRHADRASNPGSASALSAPGRRD
jgi:energy-coupling factor transporter ATP-binding protein EcfA2